MKHSFPVGRSLGLVLWHLGIGAFGVTGAPLGAQTEIAKDNTAPAKIVDLANEITQSRARGDLGAALTAAKHLVDLVGRQEGQSGVNYAHAVSMHGHILLELGRYHEAELLFRQVLALRIELLGEKHPDTISSLNLLVVSLDRQRRFDESEPLHRRILALRTDVLGEKHPETISSLDDLARVRTY